MLDCDAAPRNFIATALIKKRTAVRGSLCPSFILDFMSLFPSLSHSRYPLFSEASQRRDVGGGKMGAGTTEDGEGKDKKWDDGGINR